jgi:hypothetical protein
MIQLHLVRDVPVRPAAQPIRPIALLAPTQESLGCADRSSLRCLERQRRGHMYCRAFNISIENCRRLFHEHLRLIAFVHQQQVLALQKQAELERRKHLRAEDEILKVTCEIQLRKDHERDGCASHKVHSTMGMLTSIEAGKWNLSHCRKNC